MLLDLKNTILYWNKALLSHLQSLKFLKFYQISVQGCTDFFKLKYHWPIYKTQSDLWLASNWIKRSYSEAVSGQGKRAPLVIFLALISRIGKALLYILDFLKEIMSNYCSKPYIWYPGAFYERKKLATFYCQKILMLIVITKLISIIKLEQIFST